MTTTEDYSIHKNRKSLAYSFPDVQMNSFTYYKKETTLVFMNFKCLNTSCMYLHKTKSAF